MSHIKLALLVLILAALAGAAPGQELPLAGLSHVGIRVSDPEKARSFYGGVLGLDLAFTTRDSAWYKVNDRQFLEILPGLATDEVVPMSHIAMYTDRIEELRRMMVERGVSPTEIERAPGENPRFFVRNLPGQRLEFLQFLQYAPGSPHTNAIGKSLSPRRISTHLEHAGIVTTDVDAAYRFYTAKLDFRETWRRPNPDTGRVALIHLRMPGPSGDYIELSNLSGNPNLTRARAATAAHCSLEVPDIKVAFRQTIDRGQTKDRKDPRFGLDERWQFNLFDPDGTRVEFMQPRGK